MIEVFKILQGYYNNINNISLLHHIDVATRGNKNKVYQSPKCIKVLLNMILEGTFSLTEWCHYGIVCLMLLWTLIPLIVLKVD